MVQKKIPKILFTDFAWDDFEIENKVFANTDAEVVIFDPNKHGSILETVKDAEVIINATTVITEEIIAAAKACQVIIHSGIGVDSINVTAATKYGIIVANVIGYCNDEVSDHALALLLSANRKIIQGYNQVKRGSWNWQNFVPMHRLRGKILGVVGFGKIGQSLANKVKAIGLKCIIYDPMVPEKVVTNAGVESVSLDELCSRADFISIHCPLTENTRGLFGEKELHLMKPGTYIINTARGAIIDESSLIKALKDEWIAGAALDVSEKEPPDSNNPLFQLDNVIMTPHTAFYSEESLEVLREETCDAAIRVLNGHWPKSVVNLEVKSNSRHKSRQ